MQILTKEDPHFPFHMIGSNRFKILIKWPFQITKYCYQTTHFKSQNITQRSPNKLKVMCILHSCVIIIKNDKCRWLKGYFIIADLSALIDTTLEHVEGCQHAARSHSFYITPLMLPFLKTGHSLQQFLSFQQFQLVFHLLFNQNIFMHIFECCI